MGGGRGELHQSRELHPLVPAHESYVRSVRCVPDTGVGTPPRVDRMMRSVVVGLVVHGAYTNMFMLADCCEC